MAGYLDLYSEDPAATEAQAKALAEAMMRRRAAGTVATILGGPFAGAGRAFLGDAAATQNDLNQAGMVGSQRNIQRQGLLVSAEQHRAQLAQQAAAQAEAARHNQVAERLAQSAQDQDNWFYGQDPTGGGFKINKKTGETVPLGPQGSFPGSGSGLKPQQFETDIQSLGKDMEPIGKVQADLKTLKTAAEKGNVAGFGPLEGFVPGAVVSPEAVANRQAAARVMATIIQMVSGQAASEKEVERLLKANGLGPGSTDTQFKEGVTKLDQQYQFLTDLRKSKYHPTVVETYAKRGGFIGTPPPDVAVPPAPAGPSRPQAKDKDGNVMEFDGTKWVPVKR